VSILKRHDAAEQQRADRDVIAAALAANRARAEAVAQRNVAPAAETSEEQEARSKALIAAGQAAREQRNAAIQRRLDLKQSALQLAAQAEMERNGALASSDIEGAIAAQMRVAATGALPALIDEDVRRRFPPLGFHF
jgi:hypothetical protein